MTNESEPEIACALNPQQLAERRNELLPGLIRDALEVVELPDGLRLHFESKAGLADAIMQVIEQERDCCRFLQFVVRFEPEMGPISVEVTGPPGTKDLLRSLTNTVS